MKTYNGQVVIIIDVLFMLIETQWILELQAPTLRSNSRYDPFLG